MTHSWYLLGRHIPARNVVEPDVVEHNVEGIHYGRFKQWKMKKSIV